MLNKRISHLFYYVKYLNRLFIIFLDTEMDN